MSPAIVARPDPIVAGDTSLTVDGSGFAGDIKVTLRVDRGATDFVFRAAANGTFKVGVRLGPGSTPGVHFLDVYTWGVDTATTPLASTTFTILASQPPVPPDPPKPPDPPPPDPPKPPAGPGLIISPADLMKLPTSGASWNAVVSAANQSISPSLSDQDSPANVRTLAASLVAARTGDAAQRAKVINALRQLRTAPIERALALARELGAYVIAADLVKATDAELGYDFKAWLLNITIAKTTGGPASLLESAEKRPNNWGTHAHGALAAVYAYTGDQAKLDHLHKVVLGWLGDRSKYAGFSYGDLAWQANSSQPVGINPKGSVKSGHSIDGVLPDDQRRGGGFTWPPPKENYVWEALQGTVLAALILDRAGKPTWAASDQAILRAAKWLHEQANYPATGDDTWVPWLINRVYGTSFPRPAVSSTGKNFGYTDWLYG